MKHFGADPVLPSQKAPYLRGGTLCSTPALQQSSRKRPGSHTVHLQALKKMELVPFRISGAAADQTLEHRIFQIGQHTLRIDQDVHKSGSLQRVGIQHTAEASSGI